MIRLALLLLVILLCNGIIKGQDKRLSRSVIGGDLYVSTQNNSSPFSLASNSSFVFLSTSNEDFKSFGFSLRPYWGMEFNPKSIVGLQVGFSFQNSDFGEVRRIGTTDPGPFESKSSERSIGFWYRHTVMPEKSFRIYFQPFAQYQFWNRKEFFDSELTDTEKTKFVELGMQIGLLYELTPNLRTTIRTGSVNYRNGKRTNDNLDSSESFNNFILRLNVSNIVVGLEVLI